MNGKAGSRKKKKKREKNNNGRTKHGLEEIIKNEGTEITNTHTHTQNGG